MPDAETGTMGGATGSIGTERLDWRVWGETDAIGVPNSADDHIAKNPNKNEHISSRRTI